MKGIIITIGLAIFLSGCSTVTITPKNTGKLASTPSYQESKPFYFWGLVGVQRVDVKGICKETTVRQMQSQQTFLDGFLGTITLGIYSPHTVKVWCE